MDSAVGGSDLYRARRDTVVTTTDCPSGGCIILSEDSEPYLYVPQLSTPVENLTLSFYLTLSAYTGNYRELLCFESGNFCITLLDNRWGFYGSGSRQIWDQADLTPINTWVHLLFVYDSRGPLSSAAEVTVYKNGVFYGSVTFDSDRLSTFNSEWSLGHYDRSGELYEGTLAEFRVFANSAFTASEAMEEYLFVTGL